MKFSNQAIIRYILLCFFGIYISYLFELLLPNIICCLILGYWIYRLKINTKTNDKTYELQKKAYFFLKKLKIDTIIFVQHSYRAFMYVLLFRLRKIKCVKNITMMPNKLEKNIKSFIYKQCNYNVFSKLYCISDAMKERLINFNINLNKIITIPNGVDTDIYYPIRNEHDKLQLKRKLGIPIDKKIVLYVGFLIQRKGVDILLDAWSNVLKSNNACLVMVGPKSFKGQETDKNFKLKL